MTKQEFLKVLEDLINKEKDYIKEHEKVKAILQSLEGKEINGRTLNSSRLNGFKFVRKYGMFYLVGKYEHLIGYDTENIIAIERNEHSRGFECFDNCHGSAAKERIEKIENIDIDRAFEIFSEIDRNFNALRKLFGDIDRFKLDSFNFPAYYDVLRAIYSGDSGDVELYKFAYIKI